MNYLSTRGGIDPVSFTDAVMMGLATDGGLTLPTEIPDVSHRLAEWRSLTYPELATEILSLFVDDLAPYQLQSMINASYASFDHPQIAPVVSVDGIYVMELFHGPTLAFKDFALQFLGNLFEQVLTQRDSHLNILGATSGDTGSAAISGVRGKANIKIFILHPHQRVSRIQELQMTTVTDPNVFNIAIDGSFDDGQRIIKELFNDLEFKSHYSIGAVNSVNWARVAAQIVYYFYGSFRVSELTGADAVQVCVPTGNFGNIFAGYLARRMGAPISRLICATNQNDILSRFFNTNVYEKGSVYQTHSPSMDIQIASNFERYLYYRVGEDPVALKALMQTFQDSGRIEVSATTDSILAFDTESANDEQTLATIKGVYKTENYLLDPHSAVGFRVAKGVAAVHDNDPMLCLATAHPAKFPEAIALAIGQDVADHPSINALSDRPTRCERLPADTNAIRRFIEKNAG